MNRTLIALTAGVALLAAVPATAPASTSQAAKIRKLQHDLKVVSARQKEDRAMLVSLLSCLQTVNLTQYGDPAGATFGYLYTSSGLAADAAPTSGVDATVAGDPFTAFVTLTDVCSVTGTRARAFGPSFGSTVLARAAR